METYPGKLGIQQRVIPAYRTILFDALAEVCEGGLSVFAGEVHPDESIQTSDQLNVAEYVQSHNRHFRTVESPYYLLWQDGLVRWLEEWKPDALIVEANSRYLSTRRAINWMHKQRKPVIGWGLGAPTITSQSSFLGQYGAGWRNRSRNTFLLQMDALVAYSHRGASEYGAESFPSERIYVATNAVARRPTGRPPQRTPEFDPDPTILYVGRLQARKRIDNLLHACAQLPSALKPQLWIVGDGPERTKLRALAQDIYPSAEFHGEKHGSELERYFLEADLFVLPGTGGLAVQEAMTFGLPVIVAEGDGTQEDLVKSQNGWLIPNNDEGALRNTLEEALHDPVRLRQMGTASFKIVQDEVNVEQMVSTFVKVLNSITSAPEINI
jgi:glycosyltransferase involved in cell wall biosynthesis